MESENYFQIALFEKNNWWYRARRDLLDRLLRSLNKRFDSVLDAGCGVGSNLNVLSRYSEKVYGVDISDIAMAFCADKGYKGLIKASIIGFESKIRFDLIVCMDVLEHLDDGRALACMKAALAPGGMMIFTVPAHNYLWNTNDIFSHHLRRYSLREVKDLAVRGGLDIIKLSYWNQTMFLPALIYCVLFRIAFGYIRTKPQNNLNLVPKLINGLLYSLLTLENRMFLRRDLPAGVSIVCVCRNIC